MQKQETLAQLIYRTVLEFEQRQAVRLPEESHLKQDMPCSNLSKAKQSLSNNKSKSKQLNPQKKTA
jgi:hypothetical protein